MKFETYIPCDILKPFVRAFAITEEENEKLYKVLPGTGLVIGFQYKGNISVVDNGTATLLSSSGLTGLHDRYRIFKNAAGTGTVLVYFKEAGAAAFFKQPVHEVFRQSISLDNFMLRSGLLILEEQLCVAKKDAAKIKLVEQFLIARMHQAVPDSLVMAALALIHKSKGNIRIKELARELHISQSPLEKRFRQLVGTSPKKFASILRFKYLLQNHNPAHSLTDAGYEAGFYDQAHFIKEFKNFTGETPEAFFS